MLSKYVYTPIIRQGRRRHEDWPSVQHAVYVVSSARKTCRTCATRCRALRKLLVTDSEQRERYGVMIFFLHRFSTIHHRN